MGTYSAIREIQNLKEELLLGRTKEQQKVVKYFLPQGGCFSSSPLTDQQYEEMVKKRLAKVDYRERALEVHGLEFSQVSEIEPICFESYHTSDNYKNLVKRGKDGKYRTSDYAVTWIFFSDRQVYVFKHIFSMLSDEEQEVTLDCFYNDITNIRIVDSKLEKGFYLTSGCMGGSTYNLQTVENTTLQLVLPGDSFTCSVEKSSYTDMAVRGMKEKWREKKISGMS